MKRVKVHGHWYDCIRDAWLAHAPEGLTYGAVVNRILRGWEPHRAVVVRPDWNSNYRRGMDGQWNRER